MMSQFKLESLTSKLVAAMCVVVFIAAGCSRSPLGIEDEKPEPQLLRRAISQTPSAQLSPADLYAEQVISADTGGQLALYDVVLDIPSGAIDNDTLFSIYIPDINVFYNEFGTEGLVFEKPVEVTMSYRDADLTGVDESTIRIGWYNENTGQFQDLTCEVDHDNKLVTGDLHHFSAYALISD